LGLLLGADEQDVTTLCGDVAHQFVGLLKEWDCLLEIEDVNAVAFGEDEGLHLRVPAVLLVPEMDACFEQGLETYAWVACIRCLSHVLRSLVCCASALITPRSNRLDKTNLAHRT